MRILFLDIDTLRADHMGCYGYTRNTTPNLDQIAQAGTIFHRYYCTDAPCLPSRASLVTGMFGLRNGAVGHGGTAADKCLVGASRGFRDPHDENNLWHVFRKAGMYTASISTFAERHSSQWFNAGFHETHNVGGGGMESGEQVLPVALQWLDRNGQKDNWLLHLHLWDPHTPYRAPLDFGNPFEQEPLPAWITEEVFAEHLAHVGPHSVHELNMFNDEENPRFPRHPGSAKNLTELRRVFDGYDCGIRYADTLLGQVFDRLRDMGIYEDTAVIITADHGENMGELGIYAEHATADHATCRIPMIIKWPALPGGRADWALHGNIDLAPTMADLLGVEKYDKWDGQSYAPTLTDGTPCGRDALVLSQMAHVCQRSVRFGDWLYIRTYHDGMHLFDREMLYNITHDPHEQFDVKNEHPEICDKAAKILLDWFDNHMALSDTGMDPMRTVLKEGGPYHSADGNNTLEIYCRRLQATGRGDGAEKLRAHYEKPWRFGE